MKFNNEIMESDHYRDAMKYYRSQRNHSLANLKEDIHGIKMYGAVRVIVFLCGIVVFPVILLIIPIYLKHEVYHSVSFAVTESDVLEVAEGISSIFCQAQILKMNSSFSAFQVNGPPADETNRKHLRLRKSMVLPDDTIEYWGFFLNKGSLVNISICSRHFGGRLMIVEGDKYFKTCGLTEHGQKKVEAHLTHTQVELRINQPIRDDTYAEVVHPKPKEETEISAETLQEIRKLAETYLNENRTDSDLPSANLNQKANTEIRNSRSKRSGAYLNEIEETKNIGSEQSNQRESELWKSERSVRDLNEKESKNLRSKKYPEAHGVQIGKSKLKGSFENSNQKETRKFHFKRNSNPQEKDDSYFKTIFNDKEMENMYFKRNLSPQELEDSYFKIKFNDEKTENGYFKRRLNPQETDSSYVKTNLDDKETENTYFKRRLDPQETDNSYLKANFYDKETENTYFKRRLNPQETDNSYLKTNLDDKVTKNTYFKSRLNSQETDNSYLKTGFHDKETENANFKSHLDPQETDSPNLKANFYDKETENTYYFKKRLNPQEMDNPYIQTNLGDTETENSYFKRRLNPQETDNSYLKTSFYDKETQNTYFKRHLNPHKTENPNFKTNSRSKRFVTLTGGLQHGKTNDSDSDVSSFENDLILCHNGRIILHTNLTAFNNCTRLDHLNLENIQVQHTIQSAGYYYYIFYSDNDFIQNDIFAIFDIFKPTYEFGNFTRGCVNKTECYFPIGFGTDKKVVVEVPTRNGIENESDDVTMLISTCEPRIAVYAIFPIFIIVLILCCSFI